MTEESRATFESLGLRPELLATLVTLGYEAPTPIQERTIPVLLEGRDLIGQAQTGTGKTAAFALPILQKIDAEAKTTQALVLTPTRELAMQVAEAFHTYAKGIGPITVLPVYGGAPMHLQLRHLERGAQIVVGTPGRLIDHLERGTLKLDHVRTVVLDEADEMLRMGFIDDVEMILSKVQSPRQTALFSATMPPPIQRIASRHLTNPAKIEIEHKTLAAPAIEQRFLNVNEPQKLEVLTKLLELEPSEATLVFRRTKTGAAELAEKLEARGFAAQAMHGDMTQSLRESVIRRLKAGQVEIVVATDVAARGLDVEQISHVVNYDIPHDEEVYVHRIGRTGRAGRSGVATLFVTPRERRMLRDIERFTGGVISPMKMPTRADVHAKRVSLFKESVKKGIDDGDLDLYVALVNEIAEESGRELAEVAAAAARIANASRSLEIKPEDFKKPEAREPKMQADDFPRAPKPRSAAREAFSKEPKPRKTFTSAMREWPEESASGRESFGAVPSRERAPRAGKHGDPSEPKARLFIGLGSEHGLTAGNVVGSIANEADVPGRDIGPIEIGETTTIVVVPERVAELVIEKLADARLRGKSFRIRREGSAGVDRDATTRPAAKPYKEKPAFAERRAAEPQESDEETHAPTAGERLRGYKRDDRASSAPPRAEARERKPYSSAGASSTRPPFRKPYPSADRSSGRPAERKPYASADRASSRPTTGAKPFYKRFQDEGAPPRSDDREKRPFRANSASPAGDKPYRSRAAEGGAPPRKDARGKKPYAPAKGGYSKPGEKAPFYKSAPGKKFKKKPK